MFFTEKAKIPEMVIKARRAFFVKFRLHINFERKVWKSFSSFVQNNFKVGK